MSKLKHEIKVELSSRTNEVWYKFRSQVRSQQWSWVQTNVSKCDPQSVKSESWNDHWIGKAARQKRCDRDPFCNRLPASSKGFTCPRTGRLCPVITEPLPSTSSPIWSYGSPHSFLSFTSVAPECRNGPFQSCSTACSRPCPLRIDLCLLR